MSEETKKVVDELNALIGEEELDLSDIEEQPQPKTKKAPSKAANANPLMKEAFDEEEVEAEVTKRKAGGGGELYPVLEPEGNYVAEYVNFGFELSQKAERPMYKLKFEVNGVEYEKVYLLDNDKAIKNMFVDLRILAPEVKDPRSLGDNKTAKKFLSGVQFNIKALVKDNEYTAADGSIKKSKRNSFFINSVCE